MRILFSWFRAFIDISIFLGLIVGSGLSALGLLAFIWPDFDILNQFQLLFLALTVICSIASFIWPYRFGMLKSIAQWILLVPFTASFIILGPEIYRSLTAPTLNVTQVSGADSRALRIMSFNIYLSNWDAKGSLEAIKKYDPDLIILQEFPPNRYKKITEIKKLYPYQATCKSWRICTLGILSKFPLQDIDVQDFSIPNSRDPIHGRLLSATAKVPGYRPLRLHSFHAEWPAPFREQAVHFERLRTYLDKQNKRYPDTILAGDFNSSGWSLTLNDFAKTIPLIRHSFFKATYPTPNLVVKRYLFLPAFLSLDHIFSSPSVPVFNVRRGYVSVSDHHPLLAEALIFKK